MILGKAVIINHRFKEIIIYSLKIPQMLKGESLHHNRIQTHNSKLLKVITSIKKLAA